ncbi:hypothetical protein L3V82_12545 [Thiotrichales bacterium 19S3-7]|nr:hypothetical protein [Thiotrichales bacterium 19S3-7]MCF6803019.1 hypothetical protein [Thiotrichales bacterium 19S3-11]
MLKIFKTKLLIINQLIVTLVMIAHVTFADNNTMSLSIYNNTPYTVKVTLNNSINSYGSLSSKQISTLESAYDKTLAPYSTSTHKYLKATFTPSGYMPRIDMTFVVTVSSDASKSNYKAADRFRFGYASSEYPDGTSFIGWTIIKTYDTNGLVLSQPYQEGQSYHTYRFDINTNKSDSSPPPTNDNPISIGLGDISFKTGFGNTISYDDINKKSGYYQIHFSSTNQSCTLNNGIISCDPGIAYETISSRLVFLCSQAQKNASVCPWVIKSTQNTSSLNAVNYHVV